MYIHLLKHFVSLHFLRWLTAYSTAASFRYSHFFICLLSQCSILTAGLGFKLDSDGSVSWYEYRVARPLNVEIPRSLGVVVTSWNLPMHQFLKNCVSYPHISLFSSLFTSPFSSTDVFKPAVTRTGRFGAILVTYIASALLHVSKLKMLLYVTIFTTNFIIFVGFKLSVSCSSALNRHIRIH